MAMLDLEPLNAALKVRGLRMQVEQRSNALVVRGTFPDSNGSCRRRRIPLNLLAVPASLVTAEDRCIALAAAIGAGSRESSGARSRLAGGASLCSGGLAICLLFNRRLTRTRQLGCEGSTSCGQ